MRHLASGNYATFRTLWILLGCLLLSGAPAAAQESGDGSPRTLPLRTEKGEWERGDGAFSSGDSGDAVAIGELIGAGDFHLEVNLTVDRLDKNPARIRFDENADLGFVAPDHMSSRPARMYVNGFLFYDRGITIANSHELITTGTPFLFGIRRVGNQVSFLINGKKFHEVEFESERRFGKISFEPVHGTLTVARPVLHQGRTESIRGWTHPTRIEHPLPAEQIDIFQRGEGGYHTYRIPAIVVTTSGTLLAFCEGRRNSGSDHGDIDLLLKRSTDQGRTWDDATVVHGEPGDITIGNPVPVVDPRSGTVWLAFCRDNREVLVTSSSDDGLTWATPRDITGSVRKPEWNSWYATGPGHGLILENGRILFPANHGITTTGKKPKQSKRTTSVHAIYSDDKGETWHIGESVGPHTNEVTMAQRTDGAVVMNARSPDRSAARAVAESTDGGITWRNLHRNSDLVDPVCQGSLLGAHDESGKSVFLFSNPASLRRERLTVRLSEDEGKTWPFQRRVYDGMAAYSDLCDLGGGTYGCLYERDRYNRITFARFTSTWLKEK